MSPETYAEHRSALAEQAEADALALFNWLTRLPASVPVNVDTRMALRLALGISRISTARHDRAIEAADRLGYIHAPARGTP